MARERFLLTEDDRLWNPLPPFHVGGIVPMLSCAYAGTAYCALPHFEPAAAVEQLQGERCTVAFPVFETIWLAVLDHPKMAQADLSSLRMLLAIGTPEQLRWSGRAG